MQRVGDRVRFEAFSDRAVRLQRAVWVVDDWIGCIAVFAVSSGQTWNGNDVLIVLTASPRLIHAGRSLPTPQRRGNDRCRPDSVSTRCDWTCLIRFLKSAVLEVAGYEGSGSVEIVRPATALSAASNCSGNFRPRFSARRSMPAAARGLKEYFAGALASKISDNEHTAASLGQVEILSVKYSPRDVTRPAFSKATEDREEISSTVGGK